jgi:hypothetical protein
MSALVRLYPQAWRDRYEVEFQGLLEARPPTARDRLDILRGAIDARLHGEIPGSAQLPPRIAPIERLAGGAALVVGLALTAWTALLLRDFRGWDAGEPPTAFLIGILGAISLLGLAAAHALLGLAGLGRTRAFGPIAASIAVACFGLTAFGGGATLIYAVVASVVLAVAMAGRSIPVWLAIAWIGATVGMTGAFLGIFSSDGTDLGSLRLLVPYGLAWILIGVVVLVRGLPARTPARPIPAERATEPQAE